MSLPRRTATTTAAAILFGGCLLCCHAIKLEYDPFDMISMKSYQNISLRLSFNEMTNEEAEWPPAQKVVLTFDLEDKDSWAVEVLNETLVFDYEQIRRRSRQEVAIKGAIIGYNDLQVFGHLALNASRPYEDLEKLDSDGNPIKTEEELEEEEEKNEDDGGDDEEEETVDMAQQEAEHVDLTYQDRRLLREIEVLVAVKDKTLNNIFTLVVTCMVIINTVNMGGQLDLDVIKAVFKKPIGPAVGFCSQFLLMPLFSYGVGWLMSDDILFRLGLFVLGCCPGGTGSNFWCILLGGDINLSITMTFISTIAALGMMPFWLWSLGRFLSEEGFVIPFDRLIMSLVFLIAPISFGMWIRYRFEKAAPIMSKIIVPFTFFTVLFIFTVGVYVNLFVFQLITWQMVIAGFMVAGAGYLFGGTLAWLFRLSVPQIKAVSIETAFQNGSIAFILLKVSLPPPYGDLATVAPVAQLVITGAPLWILLAIWKIYERFFRKKKAPIEPIQDERDGEKEDDEDEADPLTRYAYNPTFSIESKQTDII